MRVGKVDQAEEVAALARADHIRLYQFVRAEVRSATTAADIAQECWLRVITALKRAPIDNLRAYLFRAARNAVIDHHRRSRSRATWHADDIPVDALASDAPSAERILIGQQELARLLRIVGALPARRQQVFVLRVIEQVDQQTIASTLGISRGAVEKHLRLALADCVAQFYGAP